MAMTSEKDIDSAAETKDVSLSDRMIPENLCTDNMSEKAERVLEALLRSYASYYTIEREHPAEPFAAEAYFSAHGETYFLLKAAKYAEMDAREYVFFAMTPRLDEAALTKFESRAWELCLERAEPKKNHRNTDCILYIITDEITAEAAKKLKKLYHYKSYQFGMHGWSACKAVAYECPTGKRVSNRPGRSLEAFFARV